MIAESRDFYIPSRTATGYPGICYFNAVYGYTVEEVARKAVEENNRVTTMQCGQRCRNPARLYDVDEDTLTYRVQSLCTGIITILMVMSLTTQSSKAHHRVITDVKLSNYLNPLKPHD